MLYNFQPTHARALHLTPGVYNLHQLCFNEKFIYMTFMGHWTQLRLARWWDKCS